MIFVIEMKNVNYLRKYRKQKSQRFNRKMLENIILTKIILKLEVIIWHIF